MVTLTASRSRRRLRPRQGVLHCCSDRRSSLQETEPALQHAAGFLRTRLSHRLRLRTVPQLHFVYDASVERGMRLVPTDRRGGTTGVRCPTTGPGARYFASLTARGARAGWLDPRHGVRERRRNSAARQAGWHDVERRAAGGETFARGAQGRSRRHPRPACDGSSYDLVR